MKKLVTVCALGLLAVGFSSCKKDYTCECTFTPPAIGGIPPYTTSTLITDTKRKARKSCENQSTTLSFGGFSIDQDCRIK